MAKMNRFKNAKKRQNPRSPCMYPMEYTWMSAPTPVTMSVITSESSSIR